MVGVAGSTYVVVDVVVAPEQPQELAVLFHVHVSHGAVLPHVTSLHSVLQLVALHAPAAVGSGVGIIAGGMYVVVVVVLVGTVVVVVEVPDEQPHVPLLISQVQALHVSP